MCALKDEGNEIIKETQIISEKMMLRTSFTEGIFQNRYIVYVACGLGKTTSAACTQMLIEKFEVDVIFFVGTGGALDKKLKIGDVVIGKNLKYHDARFPGNATNDISYSFKKDFAIDSNHEKVVFQVIEEHEKDSQRKFNIFFDTIITGDTSVKSPITAYNLRRKHQAVCVEMEGASVAHICYLNKKPCVIIRGISDFANLFAFSDFKNNMRIASQNAIYIMKKLIKIFPAP